MDRDHVGGKHVASEFVSVEQIDGERMDGEQLDGGWADDRRKMDKRQMDGSGRQWKMPVEEESESFNEFFPSAPKPTYALAASDLPQARQSNTEATTQEQRCDIAGEVGKIL